MDPLSSLQNRIEQLEARLGYAAASAAAAAESEEAARSAPGGGGESATEALLAAASCIDTATAGQDKLAAATQRASELNNYTDPNFVQNMQESDMRTQEILGSEPTIQHHCHCMHACQKAEPVLESEALQAVPQMEVDLAQLKASAAHLRQEADQVCLGVSEVAETCGAAAASATDVIIDVANRVEAAENKLFPKRRNGLD